MNYYTIITLKKDNIKVKKHWEKIVVNVFEAARRHGRSQQQAVGQAKAVCVYVGSSIMLHKIVDPLCSVFPICQLPRDKSLAQCEIGNGFELTQSQKICRCAP